MSNVITGDYPQMKELQLAEKQNGLFTIASSRLAERDSRPPRLRHPADLVGTAGVEPTRISPLAPKASASANFATCP
jgi:hypothetical protein